MIGATVMAPLYNTLYKPLDAAGDLMALADGPQNDNAIRSMNDPKVTKYSLLPGVASYRNTSRNLNLEQKLHNTTDQTRSETLGQWTTLLGGIGIGYKMKHPYLWALGAIGTNLGGAVLGRFSTPRTPEQQKAYYDSKLMRLGNYIVPGMGAYNRTRSLNISDYLMT